MCPEYGCNYDYRCNRRCGGGASGVAIALVLFILLAIIICPKFNSCSENQCCSQRIC